MYPADTLTGAYLLSTKNTQGDFEMVNALKILPVSEEKHDEILNHTSEDEVLQLLNTCQTIKQLHSSYVRINECLRRARECLFCPGMTAEIKEYISQCEICNHYSAKQPKEMLMGHEAPDRPWEKIVVDNGSIGGKDYLITVNCFSNFWEIDRLRDSTKAEESLCKKRHSRYCNLRQWTTVHGYLSTKKAAQAINKQTDRPNPLSRWPRTFLRKPRKAKPVHTLQYSRSCSSPVQRLLGRRTKT